MKDCTIMMFISAKVTHLFSISFLVRRNLRRWALLLHRTDSIILQSHQIQLFRIILIQELFWFRIILIQEWFWCLKLFLKNNSDRCGQKASLCMEFLVIFLWRPKKVLRLVECSPKSRFCVSEQHSSNLKKIPQ